MVPRMVAPLSGDTTIKVEFPTGVGVALGEGEGDALGRGVAVLLGVGVAVVLGVGVGVAEPEMNWASTLVVICSAAELTRDGEGL